MLLYLNTSVRCARETALYRGRTAGSIDLPMDCLVADTFLTSPLPGPLGGSRTFTPRHLSLRRVVTLLLPIRYGHAFRNVVLSPWTIITLSPAARLIQGKVR